MKLRARIVKEVIRELPSYPSMRMSRIWQERDKLVEELLVENPGCTIEISVEGLLDK